MGRYASADLAYGYDLGGEDYGWKFAEPEFVLDRLIGEERDEDFEEEVTDLLSIHEVLGVGLVIYGTSDYPGYMLVVRPHHHAGDFTPELIQISIDHSASMKLDKALKALGIIPTQAEPSWILAPYYG